MEEYCHTEEDGNELRRFHSQKHISSYLFGLWFVAAISGQYM